MPRELAALLAETGEEPAQKGHETMNATEIAGNRFLGQTTRVPRPSRDQVAYASDRDGGERLRRDQRAWDAAEAWAAENDRLRTERLAKLDADRTAARQRAADADAERRAGARAELETRLKARFMANPAATESDWERAKDGLITRELEARRSRPSGPPGVCTKTCRAAGRYGKRADDASCKIRGTGDVCGAVPSL